MFNTVKARYSYSVHKYSIRHLPARHAGGSPCHSSVSKSQNNSGSPCNRNPGRHVYVADTRLPFSSSDRTNVAPSTGGGRSQSMAAELTSKFNDNMQTNIVQLSFI